jgi:hypothetical protein
MGRRAPAVVALAVLLAAGAPAPAHAEPAAPPPTASPPAGLDEPDWELAYARLVDRPAPRYLRATFWEIAFLASGTIWYWADRERQVADWDFPSLRQRLTFEAWRFDNNPFPINFAWHPIDGGYYHAVARANDLGLWPSVGIAFATSMAWEWALEFREKVSINDVIVTTGAGTALGETIHWLGRYFESAPDPRWWHGVARWTVGLPRTLHHAIDGRATLRAGTTPDALGLSSDIWHRFRVALGGARARPAGDDATAPGREVLHLAELRVTAELAGIPGYLTARRLRRAFAEGNLTSLDLAVTLGEEAIGLDLRSDAILTGWHRQDLDGGVGRATTVGLGLGYDYRRELLGPWTDRLALMHLPGLAVDHHRLGRRQHLRGRVRLGPDFAGLHAAAYPRWRAAHPDGVEKTILRRHGYYYGWGGSLRADVEWATRPLTVGVAAVLAAYASVDGLDRSQENVTVDVDAADRLLTVDLWARVRLTGPLHLEARVTREERRGRVGDVPSDRHLDRWRLALGGTF